MSGKIELGKIGESDAVQFLKNNGYKILEQNFRAKMGEVDIIALDGKIICFIEVKTRTSEIFGNPLESISPAKQRKIARVATTYLMRKNLVHAQARFDIVAILKGPKAGQDIELIKNAFEVS